MLLPIVFFLTFLAVFVVYIFLQLRLKFLERKKFNNFYYTRASQEDTNSIFSISGNVEARPSQTLANDAFISIQHINTVHQMNNKSAQNDEPPSYEEAIKMSNSGQPPAFTTINMTPSQDERTPSPVPVHSSPTH